MILGPTTCHDILARAVAGQWIRATAGRPYSISDVSAQHCFQSFCNPSPQQFSPASASGLAEGSGPLGVAPTGIVELRAFDIARCSLMHVRRARSTTKSGFPMAFSGPLCRVSGGILSAPRLLRSTRNDSLWSRQATSTAYARYDLAWP